MERFRVFIERVDDPENPDLIARLTKLTRKKDERAVRALLANLPALLADRVEKEAAERLRGYLENQGARVIVKEIRWQNVRGASRQKTAGSGPAALKLAGRFGWGFEILRATWGRQATLLLLIAAVMLGAESAIAFGVAGALATPSDNPMAIMRVVQSPVLVLSIFVIQIAVTIVMFWYQAAVIQITAAFMEEGDAGKLSQLLRNSVRRTPELITAVGLLLLPLFLVFGVVTLSGSALFLPEWPAVAALSTILALVVMTFFLVGFALVGPVTVLETIGPWAALKRAWVLSRGRCWRIFGNFLILILGMILAVLGIELLVLAAGLLTPVTGGFTGAISILISLGLIFALYLVGMFLLNFIASAFYFEARVVTEGWRPPWSMVPDPSWQVSEETAELAAGRGVRAWLELLGYTIAAVALLLASLGFLTSKMMELRPPSRGRRRGLALGTLQRFAWSGRLRGAVRQRTGFGCRSRTASGDG